MSDLFKSSILPAEVQERGGKSDTKPIPGVVLVSGYVHWVQKGGEMGHVALETAQIVSNYTFLKAVCFYCQVSSMLYGPYGPYGYCLQLFSRV